MILVYVTYLLLHNEHGKDGYRELLNAPVPKMSSTVSTTEIQTIVPETVAKLKSEEKQHRLVRTSSIEKIRRFNTFICSQQYYLLPTLFSWLRSSQSTTERTLFLFKATLFNTFFYKFFQSKARTSQSTSRSCESIRLVASSIVSKFFQKFTKCFESTFLLTIAVYFACALVLLQLLLALYLMHLAFLPYGFIFLVSCMVVIKYLCYKSCLEVFALSVIGELQLLFCLLPPRQRWRAGIYSERPTNWKRKADSKEGPNVTLDGEAKQWFNKKYLGVQHDRTMTWGHHVAETISKAKIAKAGLTFGSSCSSSSPKSSPSLPMPQRRGDTLARPTEKEPSSGKHRPENCCQCPLVRKKQRPTPGPRMDTGARNHQDQSRQGVRQSDGPRKSPPTSGGNHQDQENSGDSTAGRVEPGQEEAHEGSTSIGSSGRDNTLTFKDNTFIFKNNWIHYYVPVWQS
ncbi:hypothetical protein NQ315_007375 [Exocentrus adspersus]|uniref:Uncharacterized protein n=1 Tax=Exocentrus adspersus TaxID=1586481 RepID=A0AAV8VHF8_9CUCU|nr:hypothetical protein NQ315_007375 [Exocentrus adspersus]